MNETIKKWYEGRYEEIDALRNDFWSNPETAFEEFYACKRTADYLKENGFEDIHVFDAEEKGNEPNTVIAKYGSGKPVIGICSELDALPGLGQDAVPYYSPKEGAGHGCGHCLMASAGVTAAVAFKEVMKAEKLGGTLVFIGCPAEETLAGKAVLARDGYFDELDVALIWHPGGRDMDFSTGMEMAATTNILFEFFGKTAHGGTPWQGRSALDAAELMNVGVQYLREHVTQDCRMHYVYRDGGEAPNIVPEHASVYYFLRSREENNDDLVRRVKLIAEGAAKMTETEVKWTVEAGCHSYHANKVLSKYGYESAIKVPPITYTEEEYKFAREMYKNATGKEAPEEEDKVLPSKVLKGTYTPGYAGGSTDVADLAMKCPTIQLSGYGCAMGLPGHHWTVVATSGMSIGTKAVIHASMSMAQFAYDMLKNPSIIEEAKEEFKEDYPNPYICKIPKEQ